MDHYDFFQASSGMQNGDPNFERSRWIALGLGFAGGVIFMVMMQNYQKRDYEFEPSKDEERI